MKSYRPFVQIATPIACLALTSVALLFPGRTPVAQADQSNPTLQMALGNPDNATAQASNTTHYLMKRSQFALSYNDTLRYPNWVAWHLSKTDIGSVERGQFQPDSSLPSNFKRITPSDYTRSGYDRGHNCPSKDRSSTRSDNDAVFYMTNMTPQAHGMNAGPWEGLESYSRDLVKQGNELFIYCGHGFSAKTHKTIGRAGIAVPDYGWKVVVVVPNGAGDPLRRINATTRVIAVRMPNINTISRKDWREYRTSVDEIEQATGLKFFTALPAATAASLKNRVDFDQSAPSKVKTPPGSSVSNPPASTSGKVWVNTRSGAYWRPGTQYYGKTKEGKYMTEAEAIKAGYHAAGGQ
jgi:DNA/RNA endonuclease G (NUC1)